MVIGGQRAFLCCWCSGIIITLLSFDIGFVQFIPQGVPFGKEGISLLYQFLQCAHLPQAVCCRQDGRMDKSAEEEGRKRE